ncbi:MAG: Rieske 2Fe-2S domain-containing protein [Stellaceae bacterium]
MATSPSANRPSRPLPYSGYHHRPPQDDDHLLTQVGPGTSCGEYLRRYWHPFMLASELKDLPKAVRLLGEDLVVFRDRSGRIGLLHRHCIHRGASLEFGIPVERGIMCCYHGWHFDIDGTVLATPAEPETSNIRHNFCQGAYAACEAYGLIFAYLGPPHLKPALPAYDTFDHPADTKLAPFSAEQPCNWLQIVENAADPIHTAYLHAIVSQQFSRAFAVQPALDFVETPLGFLSMATRRVKDRVFMRASDVILPNVGQFTAARNRAESDSFQISTTTTRWVTPYDDHNSVYIGVAHLNTVTNPEGRITEDMFGVGKRNSIGQTPDRPYEERQREPGDYDAVVAQGVVANRANEHLGSTDRGIVLLRRMLRKAIAAAQEGTVPATPRLAGNGPTPTYTHAAVMRLPSETALGDFEALERFGREAAQIVIETDRFTPKEREAVAEDRIRRLLAEQTAAPA